MKFEAFFQDSRMLRKVQGLLATQTRGRKRLIVDVNENEGALDGSDEKKIKSESFNPQHPH